MYYYESQTPQEILHNSDGLQRYSFGRLHVESQENGVRTHLAIRILFIFSLFSCPNLYLVCVIWVKTA